MNAPNRSAAVAAWVNTHRVLFVGEGDPDDITRELLIPLAQHLNLLEGREVWGRLVKSERHPPFIPHDILMWKDTRQHFDVFTGAEKIEDVQPMWGENAPPEDERWIWQSVEDFEQPDVEQPEQPADPAPPQIEPGQRLASYDDMIAGAHPYAARVAEALEAERGGYGATDLAHFFWKLMREGVTIEDVLKEIKEQR